MIRFSKEKFNTKAKVWSHPDGVSASEIHRAMIRLGYDISIPSVVNHLSGETPRVETLMGYCRLFGCQPNDLMEEEPTS